MTMYLLIITLVYPTTGETRIISSKPVVFTMENCRMNGRAIGQAIHNKFPELKIIAKCIDSGVTNI